MTERPNKALEGLFYERFFYNDLISSHDDPQLNAANLMAILAFPGLLTLYWIPKYYVVLAQAPEYVRRWHALGDRFLWIAFSMTIVALLAALQWESLLPDRRDMSILGPQPVSASQLFVAQARALGRFLSSFFLLINACALFFFPVGAVPWRASLMEGTWFTAANIVSVVAASLFGFCSVAAIQSLMLQLLPTALFRKVSQWAQFAVAAAMVGALIMLFVLRGLTLEGTTTVSEVVSTRAAWALPPMWFAALGEWLTRGEAVFGPLALLAVAALTAAAGLALLGFALSYRRFSTLAIESPGPRAVQRPRPRRRWDRFGLADPIERTVFLFTLRTLARSPLHRLRVGTFAAIGLAFLAIRSWNADLAEPTRALLEGPFALLFLCLVGLRGAYELPADLPANWAFRFHAQGSRLRSYLAGARKAAWAVGPIPIALVSSMAVWMLWGSEAAGLHLAGILMAAWLTVEAALAGIRKIPFTCNFVAPRAHIIIVWTGCAVAMMGFAASLASLELWVFEDSWRLLRAAAWAAAIGVAWLLWNEWFLSERGGPEFFEQPDEIQRLGLDR